MPWSFTIPNSAIRKEIEKKLPANAFGFKAYCPDSISARCSQALIDSDHSQPNFPGVLQLMPFDRFLEQIGLE